LSVSELPLHTFSTTFESVLGYRISRYISKCSTLGRGGAHYTYARLRKIPSFWWSALTAAQLPPGHFY
jgi:hypothetical protein